MEAENQKNSKCSVEADLELLRRYRNKDQEAFDELLEGHYGFIRCWVRRFSEKLSWVDWDDRLQLGIIGFWKAANTFKVLLYGRFHPWARHRMWWAIHNSPEVRVVKRTQHGNNKRVKEAQEKLMRELDRMPTLEEIGKKAKLTVRQVDNALNAIAASTFSLEDADRPIEIEDPRQIEELNRIEDQLEETYQLVREAIKQLTAGQIEVIIRYYFSKPTTDSAIAEELGVAEKTVTVKRRRAIKKLGEIIAGDRRWTPRILNSF